MDPTTELASDFTVGCYEKLRQRLTVTPPDDDAWRKVVCAMQRRIEERFLRPIQELARFDDEDVLPFRPGFAILALDCLLIDTIQSFREGRAETGEVSPAVSFKAFLKSPRFANFKSKDRGDFFGYVRNAILHNGETRKDWKIRIDTKLMLERNPSTGTRTINRQQFHAAVSEEFRDLVTLLLSGDAPARESLLRRLDSMAGFPIDELRNFYFAYGSNLADGECRGTARDAEGYGVAFLPAHRLVFTKHSTTRGGDAATIIDDPNRMVWGYVYRMTDRDRDAIKLREGGYEEVTKTVYLGSPSGADFTPIEAFTFAAKVECPKKCGPSAAYLDIVIRGAQERSLPDEYLGFLGFAPRSISEEHP
ncbi:MAG: gamma-glutamylcyclotransferase family protein [Terracidiphilus sp.]